MPILWAYYFLELKFWLQWAVEHMKIIWHIKIVYCDGVIVYNLIRKNYVVHFDKKDRLKIPASTWSNVLSASSDTCHEERIMIIFPKYIV